METTPVHIRPGRAADALALARLCTELGYPSTEDRVRTRLRRLDNIDYGFFVAEAADGALHGVVTVHVRVLLEDDPFAELTVLVVTESARGHGTGAALVAEAARWARARELERLWVRVRTERETTHSFYERLGFRLLKRQRVYEYSL